MRMSDWSSDVGSSDLPFAVTVELHRLMAAIEQGAADEAFERLDAAAERGRRQREFLRRRLDRTETGDLDERLDSGQRRPATPGGNPRSSGGNATIDDQNGRTSCRGRVCQYV